MPQPRVSFGLFHKFFLIIIKRTYHFCRNAAHNGICRNIFSNTATSSDDNIIANSDIVHDHAVTANQDIVADSYFTYSPDMLIHVIFVQDNIAKNIVGNKSYAGSYFYIAAEREQMRFYTEIVDLKITSFALSMKITCFFTICRTLAPIPQKEQP